MEKIQKQVFATKTSPVETRKIIKKKFGRKKRLRPRYVPRYPESAERELVRLNRAYVREFKHLVQKEMPGIMRAYERTMRADASDVHYDGFSDFGKYVNRRISRIYEALRLWLEAFGFIGKMGRISERAVRANAREWRRIVHSALGIDIFEDYYKGDLYEAVTQAWVADNVSKIKSIPETSLTRMQEIILNGFRDGRRIPDLTEEIQAIFGVTMTKAEMLARDQMSTLNAQITKMQQENAGVKRYEWSSSRDSRVRDSHREFNGKVFEWSNPPEGWYNTKSRGKVSTGRRCHPGEDYCCRCVAIPIFESEDMGYS